MKKLTLLFAIVCSLQLFAEPQNGVVYVKPAATGTGASWTDALGDIQTAINLAKSENPAARKDVWVAAGEYTITTCISLLDSVNVYGSFAGTETAVAERAKVANGKAWEFVNPTTLTGNGARLMQSGGHLDKETIVDGFIMKNGNGVGTALNNSGGAVVVRGNLVYQNCIMRNNSTIGGGGAANMTGGTIRYCLIENNSQVTGANGGGGIYANSPAGYPAYIENCVVRGNSSTIRGAGIGVQGAEMTYISKIEIYNNTAIDGTTLKPGAGIYSNSANNRISNCLVYNNTGASAIYYNGGSFLNNTVVKNIGGLYIGKSSTTTLTNNVVWACVTDATGATATSITGDVTTSGTVHNNATYNPLPTDKSWNLADNILLSSNVSNGDVVDPAPGTVGSGPKFHKVSSFFGAATTPEQLLNLDSVNWNINTVSPLVNMGKVVATVTGDFAGVNRPQGFPVVEAKYDIGAYELPYYLVVAGEGETGNGYVYSSMGEVLAKDYTYGYAKGSKLELFFEPKAGYKMERAYYTISTDGGSTFTGAEVDFKQDIDQDGFWSMTVQNSFKVNIVWTPISGLQDFKSTQINCFGTNGGVQINGIEKQETIRLFNLSGMEVYKVNTSAGDVFINVPQGVYVVRIADKAAKVVVK